MKNKDQRTSIMSEILNNIRSIKLYAWESSFAQKLFDVRNNKELVMLRKMGYLSSSSNFLWSFTPFVSRHGAPGWTSALTSARSSRRPSRLLRSPRSQPSRVSPLRLRSSSPPSPSSPSSASLSPCVDTSRPFARRPLPLLTLTSMAQVLPIVFASLVEAYVSIDRVTDFLCGKELQTGSVSIELPQGRDTMQGDELISVVHGEFSWNTKANTESTLADINLSLKKGELLAVVGRVGAGKSSLLSAVLGEMTKTDGRVTIRGTVAYCAQQPWIMGEPRSGRAGESAEQGADPLY